MILDSHVHFWTFDPVRDAWITGDMAVIKRDFYPHDIAPLLTQNGVDGIVAVQASQSDAETAFLLQLAQDNPFIKGVVGWIDLTDSELDFRLEAYKNLPKLKGFRHIVQGEPEGFLVRDEIVEGIKEIGRQGFTYDILIYGHQLHDAIQLSQTLPGQPFVVDHCAKPALKSNDITTWKQQIKELAQNPDVYCKVSGLLTEDHWHNCNEKQLQECLDVVFNSFGTQRVLFGSDWPVMLLAGSYAQWVQMVKSYIGQFTQQEQENILGGNARRFYTI